jgi:hypothetical protein
MAKVGISESDNRVDSKPPNAIELNSESFPFRLIQIPVKPFINLFHRNLIMVLHVVVEVHFVDEDDFGGYVIRGKQLVTVGALGGVGVGLLVGFLL